ncbi:VCBS repeat-containing protein [candidate division KSB1 bacterium]|nr:VCBS repeat-containing protein [candidate division KSB1 bacterium]
MKKRICFLILFIGIITNLFAQDPVWQIEYQAKIDGEKTAAYSGGFDYPTPVLVDIDADGDLDLFIGYSNDNGVCFIRNDGTNSKPAWVLISRNIFDFRQAFTAPTFCDIDHDGDLDAFVGGWDGKIRFVRNTGSAGNPAWKLETDDFASTSGPAHSAPAFCDMDGDGDDDLLIGNTDGDVRFYRNTGSDTAFVFTLENDKFAIGYPGGYCFPLFYDIDNDGDQDLFVGAARSIYFYENQGTAANGAWTLITETYKDIRAERYAPMALGDLDGDHDPDMIIGESDDGLSYYRNKGDLSNADWELVKNNYMTIDVLYPCFPAFVDIDNDNDYDMFLGRYFWGIVQYLNQGDMNEPDWLSSDKIDLAPGYIPAFCDIDDDGDQDAFLGQINDGTLKYVENLGTPGNAVWSTPDSNYAAADVGDGYCSPAFTDIDADGDFDLFLGSGEGNLYFLENTGTAGEPAWAAPVADYASATQLNTSRLMPEFYDIDKDGDPDLFVGGYNGRVAFYRNIGSPDSANFKFVTPMYNDFRFDYQTRPVFCDIDGDGDRDMFWGMAEGGLLFWRNAEPSGVEKDKIGTSPGSFVLQQNYPNPFNPVTTINYRLYRPAMVTIRVFDIRGREIKTLLSAQKDTGVYSVKWEGTNNKGDLVSSGVYFYRMEFWSGKNYSVDIKKMILVR